MKISIFGLGYVGIVSAACLASRGHHIVGVDITKAKIEMLNAGLCPIVENGLPDLIRQGVDNRLLSATDDAEKAILATDVSFICVGTANYDDGRPDLTHLERVCQDIGNALKLKSEFHVVAVRSTVLPGTIKTCVIPILEKVSGKKAGLNFGVCSNPEFMREGNAVNDFSYPEKTVIGELDERSGDCLQVIYKGLPGALIRCRVEVAEMAKYTDNSWHAVKVAFANEIGKICKMSGIDSHVVMDIFYQDNKLNLSSSYLTPGFAFGGSCLPKDIRALSHKASGMDIKVPLLDSVLSSNEAHIDWGMEMIRRLQKKTIGLLGFSFKAGTDDLRESPLVSLIEQLLKSSFEVRLYDSNIDITKIMGANRDYILKMLPDIERYMAGSVDELLEYCDVIVIGNHNPEFAQIAHKLKPEHEVIDFVRIKQIEDNHLNYHGICW